MNRRSFMQSILVAGVAPAVVGSGILMPIRSRASLLDLSPSWVWVPGVGTFGTIAEAFDWLRQNNRLLQEYHEKFPTYLRDDTIWVCPKVQLA